MLYDTCTDQNRKQQREQDKETKNLVTSNYFVHIY